MLWSRSFTQLLFIYNRKLQDPIFNRLIETLIAFTATEQSQIASREFSRFPDQLKVQKGGNDFPFNGSIEHRDQVTVRHLQWAQATTETQSIGKNRQRSHLKRITISKRTNAMSEALWMTWMDRYCACSFEHRHIGRKTTHSKCRSAIIPNKRSLNFILVFSYKFLFLSFSLGLFWPLKKNISQHIFRLLFSSWHRCGQSAIRIDICGFRRNIKDNKKNCIHIVKHVVKTHFDTQRRHRYNPLECERKRFFFCSFTGQQSLRRDMWHFTISFRFFFFAPDKSDFLRIFSLRSRSVT